MRFFAELFRVEDWKRLPTRHSLPLAAFLVTSILMTIVLMMIEWPSAPWRILVALMGGVMAASVVRWATVRKIRREVD